MDIAVLADIHGNYEALKTCVRYIRDRKIRTFLFLGDYLGEFAFPQRTMALLYELRDSCDCVFIRGNKEEYWLNCPEGGNPLWKEYDSTTGSLYYTYHNITRRDLDFFGEMEISKIVKFEDGDFRGQEPLMLCHGSPRRVNEMLEPEGQNTFEVMEQSKTSVILHAHTHFQRKIRHDGKILLNPGSVGASLCGCGRTQFMILHGEKGEWREEFISLDYDTEKEINSLYEAGLDRKAPYWCKVTVRLLRTGKAFHARILEKAAELYRAETGVGGRTRIPEKYWKQAYEACFGREELTGHDCSYHPEGKAFPQALEKRVIYESRWMTLYSDRVRMPDGFVIEAYHRVHLPEESVCVVIVNARNQVLLIRSKRYTTGRMEWELPAGRMEKGECAEDAAGRECMEETGCRIMKIQYLCSQNASNGISDIMIHYYSAFTEEENEMYDRNEVDEKRWVSREEAAYLLKNNGSRCGVSMFGLLYWLQFGAE